MTQSRGCLARWLLVGQMLRCPAMRCQSHTANSTETTLVNAFLKVTTFLYSHCTGILHSPFDLRQRWLDQYSIFNSAALVAADLLLVSYPAPLSLLSPDFTTLRTVSDCPQNYLPPAKLGIQQFWALCCSRQQFVRRSSFLPLVRLLVSLHVRPLVLLGTTHLPVLGNLWLAPKPVCEVVGIIICNLVLQPPRLMFARKIAATYRIPQNTLAAA